MKCVKVSIQFFPYGCISEIVFYYELEKSFLSEWKENSIKI